MKKLIIILVTSFTITSCGMPLQGGHGTCPTYSYTYKDLKTGDTLTGADMVGYLPGEHVVFMPSGREIVILTTTVGRTTLKLPL